MSVDAEMATLGSFLFSGLAVESTLPASFEELFYYQPNRRVFRVIRDLHAQGTRLDTLTVLEELRRRGEADAIGGIAYLTELEESVPTAAHVGDYHKLLVDQWELRELRAILDQGQAGIDEGKSAAELIATLEGRLERIQERRRPEREAELHQWPADLAPEAFHGLAGDVVRAIAPHTEADPAALLFHLLVAFGCAAGGRSFFQVGATQHRANLNAVMVGPTAKGRKGTAEQEILRLFMAISPTFANSHVVSGLSSGEGLIYHVRDPIEQAKPVKQGGKVTGQTERVIVDEGVKDKRLLVIEPEFAAALRAATREGNTLSAQMRQAWDSGNLRVLTKNSPMRATRAHIAIVGHITKDELLRSLDSTDYANGFANRFLWVAVRRRQLLPDGGQLPTDDLNLLAEGLLKALQFAQDGNGDSSPRAREAHDLWHEVYATLSAERPGMLGAVTSRAEAQVVRLSLIYALLDRSPRILVPHLEAALAAWRYCERSAAWIFGVSTGDPTADEILELLRGRPEGMNRTEISSAFARNKTRGEFAAALERLAARGLARMEKVPGGGRPTERWFAL
jgi:hypothetical protein